MKQQTTKNPHRASPFPSLGEGSGVGRFHTHAPALRGLKTLALSELRRVAERTRLVKTVGPPQPIPKEGAIPLSHRRGGRGEALEALERIPWRVWYVSASNGDCIRGEECVTLSVDVPPNCPGAFPSRLVQFINSGQVRRLRDCCILRADDFVLRI